MRDKEEKEEEKRGERVKKQNKKKAKYTMPCSQLLFLSHSPFLAPKVLP